MANNNIPKKRCAIYCRKSTDENLNQDFNSLDAQREAGENYIASQKYNGWICIPKRYEDGGFSGGNTNRPALQELLADCEAGLIDIIVVYKIDRLSRSIVDFGELSKKFDEWGVSFVAVTQDINTSTSSGRMMLNILMTFAQYEREVIAERVRDKMSASRKKGKWVGGCLPLGYIVENKKLIIAPNEAKIITNIFQRFIEIQSPKAIATELNLQGIKTKQGKKWGREHIYRILNNYTYIGEVKYKEEICKGEHQGIITREVWDRTREILAYNNKNDKTKDKQGIVAPLKSVLRCGHCDCAMMPTYSSRGSKKYFYYLCYKDSKTKDGNCPIHQISSTEVEKIVKLQLKKMLCETGLVIQYADRLNIKPNEILSLLNDEFWQEISHAEYNRLVTLLIEKVVVWEDRLEIELKSNGVKSLILELSYEKN